MGQKAIVKIKIHRYVAGSAQAANAARFPVMGQGGQHRDPAFPFLQEHLADGRAGPEITVDLEGRMGVQEADVTSAMVEVAGGACLHRLQLAAQQSQRMVAISKACPGGGFPSQAPACALVPAQEKRLPGGRPQLFIRPFPGIQGLQMRNMPVLRLGFHKLPFPFQRLALAAGLKRGQPGKGRFRFAGHGFLQA